MTTQSARPTRRDLLGAGAAIIGSVWITTVAAQAVIPSDVLTTAVAAFTNGAPIKAGRVQLDIATLVDNGNTVPITVTVESPMTAADYVTAIAVFNERNPQRDVGRFRLTPLSGKAEVAARIRMATTQKLVAVARMSDGSFWSHTVEVVVTLAACIEEG
ncbi:SoxY-related AACIE arm protein [soil metagenome]